MESFFNIGHILHKSLNTTLYYQGFMITWSMIGRGINKNKGLYNFGFPKYQNFIKPKNKENERKMTTIREKAQNYEAPSTKNISELDKVSTQLDCEEREFTDKEGKPFTISVATIDGEEYRVPNSVLKQLKGLIEETPDLTEFKVKKTGEGLKTAYQVIGL